MHRNLAGITCVCTFVLALGLAAFAAAQAPANATGTWRLTERTSTESSIRGTIDRMLTLKQDHAGMLTGTLDSRQVKGSVKGDKIEFTVSFKDRNGRTIHWKYAGTISGDSMKSTGRSISWTATRQE